MEAKEWNAFSGIKMGRPKATALENCGYVANLGDPMQEFSMRLKKLKDIATSLPKICS
jgi:hypothetical protein